MEGEMKIKIDKVPETRVKEGLAEVLFPSTNDVFYNPVQEFNRDLSIAVIKQFIKGFSPKNKNKNGSNSKEEKSTNTENEIKILEALAASGLRSIRYAKEIPNIKNIIANDYSQQAVESIKQNIKHNNVENLITSNLQEASLLMHHHKRPQNQFHIVDLDPYGSPAQFLDSAVQCVAEGGLLLVTCTDMAILCGNHSETCHAKYGAISLKIRSCHEMALRILLQSIESHANRYGRYIVPLLSLSADFYIRVFVKIYTSPNEVKQSISKLAMVYRCVGCETFHFQYLGKLHNNGQKITPNHGPPVNINCNHCGQKHQMGGPIWANNLHNQEFVKDLLKSIEAENNYNTNKRMIGVLNVISEELEDCPLYYVLSDLCAVVHAVTPSMLEFRSAILNAGYKVSLSHACKESVKTNAPSEIIWDIIRAWIKLHPVKRDLTGTSADILLHKESKIEEISFKLHPEANPTSRLQNLCRFQINPQPNWGPKMRAKSSLWSTKQIEKREKFQGKKKKERETDKNMKQYPCKRFKKGDCNLGEDCRYSHNTENFTLIESTAKEET